jgi:membrane associated rhomboid family serine protease
VTFVIVVVNVLVFLYELWVSQWGQGQRLIATAGAIPYEIVHRVDLWPRDVVPPPGTIWTSMFLHGGVAHLIGNMWFLWLFGDNVEDALGRVRYAIFYIVVGTVGALAQILSMPDSTAPMIGASGCVAGVLGAYAILYPRARVSTLIMIPFIWPVVHVSAWILLGVWFLMQFVMPGSGVAWMAHVGGFLAGVGLARILRSRSPGRPATAPEVEYLPPPRRRW